ncbi:MAG: ABC transporter permease [Polyangiaceae bacterium]
MIRYAARRLLAVVPTLWVVMTVLFFLLRAVPGGPFDAERVLPKEIEKAQLAYYNLDAPLFVQYKTWLANVVLRQDLGPSFRHAGRSVNEILRLSFPYSAQLGLLSAVLALAVGVPLGIQAARKHNTAGDHAAMGVAMIGVSVPRFVLAPLLVLVFSLKLFLLPAARWETWRHMVLPVICTGLPMAAYIARLARAGMLEVIRSDFIRTARAKGLSERKIILRHALKGALLPVVTFMGPGLSGLLIGSLVVERIFNIPGMGRYLVEAASNRDYNLVMGVVLVYGVLVMVLNAIVDIAYRYLDPRVALEEP